ncbi:MAG: DNA polymerase III subunit delta [Thermoleophilia bacterium]
MTVRPVANDAETSPFDMSGAAEKKKKLERAYLITGSDETKVETAVARLRQRIIDDSGTDMNIDIFDAAVDPALTVVQSASTLPFGDGVRLVLVKDVGAWNKADKDVIVSFLADPPDYACLALTGRGIRKNEGIVKAVAEAGQVLTFDAPRPSDFPAWVQEQGARKRLKITGEAARRLVTLTGSSQRAVIGELEKLAAYLGSGAVGVEDVDRLCWVSPEVRIWDLTDALGAGDRKAVFRHLEQLLGDKAAPAAVFYSIAKHMKNLAGVVDARERGEDPAAAATALGLKPYPAKKIAAQSGNFSSAGARRAVMVLSELDADIKGRSDLRPDLLIETALSRAIDALQQ